MKLHWQLLLGALGLCAIVGIGFGVKSLIGLSASEKSSATAADLCEKLAIPKNIGLTNGELSIDSTTGLLPYLKLTCNAEFGLGGSSDKMRKCVVKKGVATWATVENPPTCSANTDLCKKLKIPLGIDLTNGTLSVVDSINGLLPYMKLTCNAEFGLGGSSDKMRACVVKNGVATWATVENPPTCSANTDLCKKLKIPLGIDLTNGTLSVVDSTNGLLPYMKLTCNAE
eukprot:451055_1